MKSMKKIILRWKLFLSTFKKRKYHENKGFIYEFDDDKSMDSNRSESEKSSFGESMNE